VAQDRKIAVRSVDSNNEYGHITEDTRLYQSVYPKFGIRVVLRNTFRLIRLLGSYGLSPRSFAHFERSKACSAKIVKLGLMPANSYNFHASLHQERLAKWSKRDSFGSLKSLPGSWITEHCSENDNRAYMVEIDITE
jgi:hypothetical protein